MVLPYPKSLMNRPPSQNNYSAPGEGGPGCLAAPPSHHTHGSKTLLSPRHEAFAQRMAAGDVSAGEAYRVLYHGCRSWETAGPRLSKNAKVAQRIAELKAEQAAESKLGRDDLRRWCEMVMTKNGPMATISSKLGAMDRLIRLCGLDKGTEAENKASDSIADLIMRIRSGSAPSTGAGVPAAR